MAYRETECLGCGKPMVTYNRTTKTCSNTCRQRLFRITKQLTVIPAPKQDKRTGNRAGRQRKTK